MVSYRMYFINDWNIILKVFYDFELKETPKIINPSVQNRKLGLITLNLRLHKRD